VEKEELPIESKYDNKIVYTTQLDSVDKKKLKKHCEQKGGEFNECGSPCAPGAATCIQVCAYACDLSGAEKDQEDDWRAYKNKDLGFSMEYVPGMEITTEREGKTVKFILKGPTQEPGTELYDGINITVSKLAYDDKSLKSFAQSEAEDIKQVGEIISFVEETVFNGYNGYKFTADTLGVSRKVYIPAGTRQALKISYSSPDPENRGYEQKVSQMLKSFENLNQEPKATGSLEDVKISNPEPNKEINSPLTVIGSAKGSWFFEGSFPAMLADWDGRIIAETQARAQEEWMTDGFVSFRAELEFDKPELYNNGTLILQKANPSGLPENDESVEIPVKFE
jgi:hypothetical protein